MSLAGKVVGVGLVDEISDSTWVVIDAVDGRVHYAELGRLKPAEVPRRDTIVTLAGSGLNGKPSRVARIQELSPVDVSGQINYDGPTWLDQAILNKWQPAQGVSGFAQEVRDALAARAQWLVTRNLARLSTAGGIDPVPDMMRTLRRSESERLAQGLSHVLGAVYVPAEGGASVAGIYDRSITTPAGRIAVIRREDTFTLAPWRPALEPFRGQVVNGLIGPSRVTWTLDRGRALPGRT